MLYLIVLPLKPLLIQNSSLTFFCWFVPFCVSLKIQTGFCRVHSNLDLSKLFFYCQNQIKLFGQKCNMMLHPGETHSGIHLMLLNTLTSHVKFDNLVKAVSARFLLSKGTFPYAICKLQGDAVIPSDCSYTQAFSIHWWFLSESIITMMSVKW